ncbi:hypothetical protein LX36DRAFT_111170 [Colletotrichum falcatum]|nr:hypothetical protein LX36DRAFT_111170 [Colletotrichum falcatum]
MSHLPTLCLSYPTSPPYMICPTSRDVQATFLYPAAPITRTKARACRWRSPAGENGVICADIPTKLGIMALRVWSCK